MNSYCEKTLIETDTVWQNSIENVMTGATLKVNLARKCLQSLEINLYKTVEMWFNHDASRLWIPVYVPIEKICNDFTKRPDNKLQMLTFEDAND